MLDLIKTFMICFRLRLMRTVLVLAGLIKDSRPYLSLLSTDRQGLLSSQGFNEPEIRTAQHVKQSPITYVLSHVCLFNFNVNKANGFKSLSFSELGKSFGTQ